MFCSEFRDRLCAQINNPNVAQISTKSKMGFPAIDSQLSDIFQLSDKIAGGGAEMTHILYLIFTFVSWDGINRFESIVISLYHFLCSQLKVNNLTDRNIHVRKLTEKEKHVHTCLPDATHASRNSDPGRLTHTIEEIMLPLPFTALRTLNEERSYTLRSPLSILESSQR